MEWRAVGELVSEWIAVGANNGMEGSGANNGMEGSGGANHGMGQLQRGVTSSSKQERSVQVPRIELYDTLPQVHRLVYSPLLVDAWVFDMCL